MIRFEPGCAISHLVVVGLGGTGSALARSIARIVYDMGRNGLHQPSILLIDPDVVEEKNVGRQAGFAPADVGQFKAEILMRRFNAALGLNIAWDTVPFDPEKHGSGYGTLLVGCVDNHLARRALAQAKCACWLDLGNHAQSGQSVCGTTSDRETVLHSIDEASTNGVTHHLPNAALVFPELLEPEHEPQPKTDASCADLVSAGVQHLLINDAVASAAASYVYRLLYRQPILSFLSFISLDTVRPVLISKENIATFIG